jgi:autotransporter-associated beta strand protein
MIFIMLGLMPVAYRSISDYQMKKNQTLGHKKQHGVIWSALFFSILTTSVFAQSTSGTFQWNGSVSSAWTNPANWTVASGIATGPAPTNGTYNVRLNVTNSASGFPMIYDATLGTTIYANTSNGSGNRGLVIGSGKSGTLVLNGGTLSTVGSGPSSDVVGNQTGTGTFIVNGGNYISGTPGLSLGAGSGTCIFTMSNGTANITTLAYNLVTNNTFPATGTINLNGGTLVVNNISRVSNGTNYLYFNGGVLKAAANNDSFITNFLNRASVQNGGAIIDSGGFNITIGQPLLHSTNVTDNAIDGGVTKQGNGTLTLAGINTYTGPTVVKSGVLAEPLPQSSSSLVLSSGTLFSVATTNASWPVSAAALTNATLQLSYGNWNVNSYTNTVLNITNLVLNGTVVVNISGTGFPATNLTLLTYGSKTGGGSFSLGTIPNGASATLTDTGSALVLNITAPSLQNLTWGALVDSVWQVNGSANWNPNNSTYLEYPSGSGDAVTFDDTSAGTVTISGMVKPASITVNDSSSYYSFVGSGQIGGAASLAKLGTSTLDILTSNSFTGGVTVSGGTLFVDNPNALGSTNTVAVVSSGGTVELGLSGGVVVVGQPISISGAGVGGAIGALRGSTSGSNSWAGPVIVSANSARIGTEISGNLTVSGPITDNGANYELFIRPGAYGQVTIAGANNTFGSTRFYGDSSGTATLHLGANNTLATNMLTMGPGYLDLNGYNQTVSGITDSSGAGVIYNLGSSASTLTVNSIATNTTASAIQDGVSQMNLIKSGNGTQKFTFPSSYTGSTRVNGGELDVALPMSSAALTLASGTAMGITVSNSSWAPTAMNVTNAAINLNYGYLLTAPSAVLSPATMNVSGNNVINITATNFPLGQTVLITYGSKNGAGTFNLGSIPANMLATLADTGSAIVLNVSTALQTLTWSGGATGTWNTNGTTDWNAGAATYQESTGLVSAVIFDDTASTYNVSVATDVRPFSMTANNSLNSYVIGGSGRIGGTNGIVKNGTNVLTLNSTNNYTGGTIINAGTLSFTNGALGNTGNIVLNGGTISILQWAPGSSQDISGRLLIGGVNSSASTTAFATLDTGTNIVTLNNGINQGVNGTAISNAVAKIGSGNLRLAGGTSVFGSVIRVNQGTLEVASGATLNLNGGTGQANAALVSDNSTILVSGGTLNIADRLALASSGNSTSVLTLSAGSLTSDSASTLGDRGIRLAGGSGSATGTNSATLNLNGGTLITAGLFPGSGSNNTSIVNFNSGVLQASDNPYATNFIGGLSHVFVASGGAIINSGTNRLAINQALENDGVTVTDGGVVKLGSGQLKLAGNNTYTGPTTVSNGVLLINGTLGTNAITVQSGATLGGTGIISGPVSVRSGGTLMPGTGIPTNEVLMVNNSLSLAGTTIAQIGKSGITPISDQITGVANISYGGTLIVTNGASAALAGGDVFTLFSAFGTKAGNFTSIQVLPASLGLTGTFNPATGQLTLVNASSPTLTYIKSGASLQFSWTGSYRLQVQTNSLSSGLGTNWFDYPGGSSSPVTVPIDVTKGSIFYRLAQ